MILGLEQLVADTSPTWNEKTYLLLKTYLRPQISHFSHFLQLLGLAPHLHSHPPVV